MIDSILHELAHADFDFLPYTNPADPLAKLFPEWTRYYRLKYAIAKALKPGSILEIGVRFGYSAISFLTGSPGARYVGIDLNSAEFGGQEGALEWARQITRGHAAEFIVSDSQKMTHFPGGIYDLIHVDGQQDGAGTFHDLRRAVSQARWVLLDGYFWTQENFLNANDFLLKYKDVVQYALTIPGYAGELLLRVSDEHLANCAQSPVEEETASGQLTDFYDANYYLNDCGGYREFRQWGGLQVTDARLMSLLHLTRLGEGAVLDCGCGRGEIAYQLAASGRKVTAVDYSAAAIKIAESCFHRANEETRHNVEFICGDVGALTLDENFGLAVAGDLVEHLSPEELDRLYREVARLLSPTGVFLIHTAPNVWRYRRDYPRRKSAVQSLGGYLPAEPRTRYELLMHINEQSPARLRRALRKSFPHVAVWVANPNEPAGSLSQKFTFSGLTSASEIYALASHAPLDLARAATLLGPVELEEGDHAQISVGVDSWPQTMEAGTSVQLPVHLTNGSEKMISSLPGCPTFLSYHWFDLKKTTPVVFDGLRTSLPFGIEADERRVIEMNLEAPAQPGSFLLSISLVREGCWWLEHRPGFQPVEAIVKITPVA